jgi:hypothetical protein
MCGLRGLQHGPASAPFPVLASTGGTITEPDTGVIS